MNSFQSQLIKKKQFSLVGIDIEMCGKSVQSACTFIERQMNGIDG